MLPAAVPCLARAIARAAMEHTSEASVRCAALRQCRRQAPSSPCDSTSAYALGEPIKPAGMIPSTWITRLRRMGRRRTWKTNSHHCPQNHREMIPGACRDGLSSRRTRDVDSKGAWMGRHEPWNTNGNHFLCRKPSEAPGACLCPWQTGRAKRYFITVDCARGGYGERKM